MVLKNLDIHFVIYISLCTFVLHHMAKSSLQNPKKLMVFYKILLQLLILNFHLEKKTALTCVQKHSVVGNINMKLCIKYKFKPKLFLIVIS